MAEKKRARRTPAASQHLQQLRQAKEELDTDRAERERREDAALQRYADAAARVEEIDAQHQRKLEEIERQRQQADEQARQQRVEVETEQAAAMVELDELGRSAEEQSRLFGIPVKRVRRTLREQRAAHTTASSESAIAVTTGEQRASAELNSSAVSEVPATSSFGPSVDDSVVAEAAAPTRPFENASGSVETDSMRLS